MGLLFVVLVCTGALTWVMVGTVTMFRHNRNKRHVLAALDGNEVDLEYRVGRGYITEHDLGRLHASGRWHIGLRSASRDRTIPLPAIKLITDRSTGRQFGPWT